MSLVDPSNARATRSRTPGLRAWSPRALVCRLRKGSLAWAGYAAFAWAVAYAVGVRGYQGLGGTLGIAGTFEDPAGMRRASLVAGVGILLVGFAALAFVRPWGLRLPRWLVIIPALTGAAYAASHALTAYVTKPLDALGLIHLQFDGWAQRDETAQFLWDLLFYEPWFLGSESWSPSERSTIIAAPEELFARNGGSSPSPPWRRLPLRDSPARWCLRETSDRTLARRSGRGAAARQAHGG